LKNSIERIKNEKTTKMEKDLNWVSHHLLISE